MKPDGQQPAQCCRRRCALSKQSATKVADVFLFASGELHAHDQRWVECRILVIVSARIADDPCASDSVVAAIVCVAVNPKSWMPAFDDLRQIGRVRGVKKVAFEPGRDRFRVRQVMRDDNRGDPISFHRGVDELARVLVHPVCCLGQEALPRILLLPDQPIVIHVFARIEHANFRMPVNPIVSPQRRPDEADAVDDDEIVF